MKDFIIILFLFLIAFSAFSACSQEPRAVHYGQDECESCKMIIVDNRFAAQLVTENGKAFIFDSIECMADYTAKNSETAQQSVLWVSSFVNPGTWINTEEAQFIRHDEIKSPMGLSLLAVKPAESEWKEGGDEYTWEEIIKWVDQSWEQRPN
ncbi:MAG: nitrous oxide reductase accessory protein NosL [Balneolaceae bacterium]